MKVDSDVLLLSYLDKIGLSLTDEAGQASAYLYSEARLYKGASLAPLLSHFKTCLTRLRVIKNSFSVVVHLSIIFL